MTQVETSPSEAAASAAPAVALDRSDPGRADTRAQDSPAPRGSRLVKSARTEAGPVRTILIEGPIAGSYSLSIVNRELGRALVALGHEVRFFQRQGPDPHTDPFVAGDPTIAARLITKTDLTSATQFDIHSRNDWPMSASPRWGRLLCAHCYGWEESLMPQRHAAELDKFDLLLFTSAFSRDAARASGVACPSFVVGNGVDKLERADTPKRGDLEDLFEAGAFHFLHVSSGLKRKGMDVGIRAFLAEFDRSEKVRLIIKTVWNETNEIFAAYDRLDEAQRRRVLLVSDEIDDASLRWLVDRADAVFLPSRGEGFLLPAAEALATGKLVVTTRCGGNEAFCDEDTCLIVETTPAVAATHLSTEGSAWFEPDLASLRAVLRRAVDMGNTPRRRMAEAAVRRMAGFRWRDVAAAMLARCEALASARGRDDGASLALVSTYNQHCGISDYTTELSRRLGERGVVWRVLSEIVPRGECVGDDTPEVRRVWTRSDAGVRAIIREIEALPDGCGVLIQHHPGILSWQSLAAIVEAVYRRRSVWVEMHSTIAADRLPETTKATIARADGLIVHGGGDYKAWVPYLRETEINVVKLPIVGGETRTTAEPCIFSFGICMPHKGFHKIIEYLGTHASADSPARARLVCSVVAGRPESVRYANELYNLVRLFKLQDRVELIFDFLPMPQVRAIARSCTLGVFAYDDVEEGASSAVRVALGEGLLTIVSPSRIFAEFETMVARMRGYDAAAIAAAIDRLRTADARDEALRSQETLRVFLRPARHTDRILQALHIGRSFVAAPALVG